MATSESWDAPVLTSSRAAATRSLPWTWRLCCSPSHQVIKVNIWTCCLTFNYFYCVQYYVMMKYHHRLKAINRNERTRKYVFNMHDKPWINEFIDIELTTNAVFYFFPLRSCLYNSLILLISWRRVLFWSSRNEFLFSRFWTYCLFLLKWIIIWICILQNNKKLFNFLSCYMDLFIVFQIISLHFWRTKPHFSASEHSPIFTNFKLEVVWRSR